MSTALQLMPVLPSWHFYGSVLNGECSMFENVEDGADGTPT